MYIYIKPKNGLSICEKWQKVSKIVHHKTVNQVFNQYNLIAKNKFEKYSFDAIKKKQVFKLFLYNYYSCLRNKKINENFLFYHSGSYNRGCEAIIRTCVAEIKDSVSKCNDRPGIIPSTSR